MTRKLSRREAIGVLGVCSSLPKLAGAESAPHFTALDHVGLTVSDSQKAASFYSRLFGNVVYKEKMNARRYVKVGPCYISLAPPGQNQQANYRVDHVCPGVEPFDIPALDRYLQSQNITFRHTDDFGPFITDPDGISIQWWTWNSWGPTIKTSAPEPQSAAPQSIFQPTGMEHVLLNVADPEKSAKFYEKLFGPISERRNNRIWFQAGRSRIGLLALPAGQRAGVNHFCVSASAFDYGDVTKKLAEAGAKIETPEIAGAPEFRDPDGVLVQVMGPR